MKKDNKQISFFDNLAEELSKMETLSLSEWQKIYHKATQLKNKKLEAEAAERERLQQEEEKRRHEQVLQEITTMDLPLTFENSFIGSPIANVDMQSPADGLILSMHNLGRVDIEYISAVCTLSFKEVITSLKGAIYQNPETWQECFYKGWETADSYLSGNLMRKYRAAEIANEKYEGYFADNLAAIELVMPPACTYKDIYVTLGSPWVPPEMIDEFIEHLLGELRYIKCGRQIMEFYKVKYEKITGTWFIPSKNRYYNAVKANKSYGTERINALYIIEKTLNMQAIKISDEIDCSTNSSGKKKVINQFETINACEKQQKIVEAFQEWIWKDSSRRKLLEQIYDDMYGCVLRQHFDGSFLTFPGMAKNKSLRDYQKNAVAKILYSPNTLLAHEVGAGKTFVMIAAGMELRRIGISKKNLYVVPNNILGQWKNMFAELYPNSRVFVISPKDFVPAKRQSVLKKICRDDFDAIIMAYSSFEMIPLSKAHYKDEYTRQLSHIKDALGSSDIMGKLSKRKEKLENIIKSIEGALSSALPEICFDDLGINTLFVDEAHNYKNITIHSKIDYILGLNKTGSRKCNEMLDKVRCVQRNNNGRGVVFATGTPITNSITDVFVMQTYLQSGELKLLNLDLFDSWLGMFAEKMNEFEIDVTTSGYRIGTRFARFHNLPELTSIFSQIADFFHYPQTNDLPTFEGYADKVIAKTKPLTDYIQRLSDRVDNIREGFVSRVDDNMLKVTVDGRKAALDIRLVDNNLSFNPSSKVAFCAETVTDIYKKSSNIKGTQLVFCDASVPSHEFNIYSELKRLLIEAGIPACDIEFIHDHDTFIKRTELFRKMNSGEVRILIGSTLKLGMGVNVQKKLIAIHHLDIPWRPSDMVQREGRILRQGNENKHIHIIRYTSESSFDAYSWQLLETKQRFIVELLSGFNAQRTSKDIDGTVLSYAEVKALAIGNPLVKRRIELVNELMRLNALNKNLVENRSNLQLEKQRIPKRIALLKQIIATAESDILHYQKNLSHEPTSAGAKKAFVEKRRKLRQNLHVALTGNVLRRSEQPLQEYQGFMIILPPNMTAEKPFVWLKATGKYRVELAGTEIGNLVRIDNRLNTLHDFIEEQTTEIQNLTIKLAEIEVELSKDESFEGKITELKKQLEKIDKQLEGGKK